ncbi:alpha/beta fold hydrolase [Nonomuraea sp. NPDC050556]|uniref:alpha/beta fold hydrolase n=1 Tax=Nonomuraea sp. NPDC050556 TaxID=3364369 RepID=UPI00379BC1BB
MTPTFRKAALALALAGAVSPVYQTLSERADRRRFPPPGRLVDVKGRKVHVWAEGEGGPTVVIVPGMTDNCLSWVRVQRGLVPGHRVVLYDRAGLGWSQAAPWWEWRSSSTLADELHRVLEASGEAGPYLLVGHSMGGEIVRLYGSRHPDRVAGMVLVDSPSERHTWLVEEFGRKQYGPLRRFKQALTYALTPCGLVRARLRRAMLGGDEPDLLRRMRQRVPADLVETALAMELTSGQRRAEVMEGLGRAGVVPVLEAERKHFGSMPLTVISKAPSPAPSTYYYEYFANRPPDVQERYARVWGRIQADLASLSDESTLIVAERAAHNIQIDEPELIVKAITEMCDKVRR